MLQGILGEFNGVSKYFMVIPEDVGVFLMISEAFQVSQEVL